MGDIEDLCYAYAMQGYLVRLSEEFIFEIKDKKKKEEAKKILTTPPLKDLVEQIHVRLEKYFSDNECKKCESENDSDAKFCKNCGEKLAE